MGLVMVGSSDPRAIDEMVKYCKETQHEKILRGLAVGIALVRIRKKIWLVSISSFLQRLCWDSWKRLMLSLKHCLQTRFVLAMQTLSF